MTRRALILVLTACCGGDHSKAPDAAIDAPVDVPGPQTLQGELVDWDSSATNFCGVFMATVKVHGGTTMITTPPNGRIRIDVPFPTGSNQTVRLDVTPGTDPSQCTNPMSPYSGPEIIMLRDTVLGQTFSARAITDARKTSFFQQFSTTFDPAKAQVFVHVVGPGMAVSVGGGHGPPIAFDGTQWAAGATGQEVFFPNVDPSAGTVIVTMVGSSHIGDGIYDVEAGEITNVTLVAM